MIRLGTSILFALALLVGCSDSSETPAAAPAADGGTTADSSTATGNEGFIEATITGSPNGHASLSIRTVPEAFAKYRDTPGGERISIHGNADKGVTDAFGKGSQSLRIYLQPYVAGQTTYTLNAAENIGAAYAEKDKTSAFYAQYAMPDHGSGKVEISSRTADRIKGTFSIVAEDDAKKASVSLEGSFDLPLVADGN